MLKIQNKLFNCQAFTNSTMAYYIGQTAKKDWLVGKKIIVIAKINAQTSTVAYRYTVRTPKARPINEQAFCHFSSASS